MGTGIPSPDMPAQHFREAGEMVQGGHHIWALKGTACAGRGPYALAAQHALLLYLAEGTWQTGWMGRAEITEEQGRAILVGLDSKQCVGRGGRTDCRDVSGFLTLGAKLAGAPSPGQNGEAPLWVS